MNIEEITSVLRDPSSSPKLNRKVLRLNNMEVVNRFSNVKSEYLLQDRPDRRMRYLIQDDMYQKTEERLINGVWEKRYRYTFDGLQPEVEKKFFKSLSKFIKECIHVR